MEQAVGRTRSGAVRLPEGKFGVSWEIVPNVLREMLMDRDAEKSQRVTRAFLQMKKFDMEALHRSICREPLTSVRGRSA